MDLQAMQTLISTVGFPIFACVYHMITMKKTLDTNTQVMIRLEKYLDDNSKEKEKAHE
ncbi:hypothetical protein CON65_12600 [Bacillus pseudomycoides]|uniref:YvrJ family protein n=1 Tax=Bacillus pseudomycoides TaxID=64104 RepID=A0AA91ZTG2_9BACI|nr:hypothetical protein CON65_12600 [Bacillus pseudomycoides]